MHRSLIVSYKFLNPGATDKRMQFSDLADIVAEDAVGHAGQKSDLVLAAFAARGGGPACAAHGQALADTFGHDLVSVAFAPRDGEVPGSHGVFPTPSAPRLTRGSHRAQTDARKGGKEPAFER